MTTESGETTEGLRRLATEALAWMDSSVTDKPYSLCRDLRAALASHPTQEGDGARERVSAAKESK